MIEYIIHEYLGTYNNMIRFLSTKNVLDNKFGLEESEIQFFNPEIREGLQKQKDIVEAMRISSK